MQKKQVQGQFITILGERYYEIQNYDEMQPFFISLASDTDLWMYLSSTGGLTAGRQSPEHALFPYYTDDKIADSAETTGPKTIIKVKGSKFNAQDTSHADVRDGEQRLNIEHLSLNYSLWEPFSDRQLGQYNIQRKIAKSVVGNKLVFCEENLSLGLRFSYLWAAAGKHGWVRRATLENLTDEEKEIELLDGLQNVLPAGVERKTQNEFSTLVDGYKKTELINVQRSKSNVQSALALFRMEAILVDRAEPSESLRCNTIYTLGLPDADYLLSSQQLRDFRRGFEITAEAESKGVRGALFAHARFVLGSKFKDQSSSLESNVSSPMSKTWYFVCDTDKDAVAVRDLMHFAQQDNAIEQIEQSIAESTEHLVYIVAKNDGVQHTADEHNDARHFANTLFNTMRGGYYLDNYQISGSAFRHHVELFNHRVAEQYSAFLDNLPETLTYSELYSLIEEVSDHTGSPEKSAERFEWGVSQLMRLFYEYLPLTFSRRHGDPSRPWNLFNIRVQDNDGRPIVSYQGNWRDIFQNWEALSFSYPGFINSIISKFLNATTADGYNPYKVTSEGIDWEVIEPENPWSNIGYWGDHQIIYLLKLLELSYQHDPKALYDLLSQKLFAFANVPYKFKSYNDIVRDPKNSIIFDTEQHKRVFALIPEYGQDARLVLNTEGDVMLTTMIDKLLIPLLVKFTNFIPQAGIWMNTLRPEWNDANNALVGYGASMVTACYMYRYCTFLSNVLQKSDVPLYIANETLQLLRDINDIVTPEATNDEQIMAEHDKDIQRRTIVDNLGLAGERYRQQVYARQNINMQQVTKAELLDAINAIRTELNKSILDSKRADGLYEAYNLVKFTGSVPSVVGSVPSVVGSVPSVVGSVPSGVPLGKIELSHLYPMLEGQVAVITSGALSPQQVADLLDTMRQSDLYRPDQRSYMLYPNRRRKTFLELNNIPQSARALPVVHKLLASSQSLITEDREGGLHFNPSFNNADFLEREALQEGLTADEIRELKDLYEQVFNHHAFTGRSGTFYKYEGLGCIYWHMVSKLLLAVGETIEKEPLRRLIEHYEAIREGIGSHKTPQEYGSFPFDAYSHTPSTGSPKKPTQCFEWGVSMFGVQQPGMTGQVKEDIINRFFELGLTVDNGDIYINPLMLTKDDFLDGELHFTYCQTPFTYSLGEKPMWEVVYDDGYHGVFDDEESVKHLESGRVEYVIPADIAQHIFMRDKQIKEIKVTI